jgi:general secretion pathway protein G
MNDSENASRSRWRISPIDLISLLFFVVVFVVFLPPPHHPERTAKLKTAIVQIGALGEVLDIFKSDTGDYPAATNGLNDLVVKPAGATTNWHQYLDNIPLDPWGHPYLYEYPGKHRTNSYDLSSAGPDGKFETQDDIANWQ